MKRKIRLTIFILFVAGLVFFTLPGCKFNPNKVEHEGSSDSAHFYERTTFAMGTVITQKIYGENAEEAAEDVVDIIESIENKMTVNTPGGEINKLNAAIGKEEVSLSEESIYVLEKAKDVSEISGGAFDVTLGPLIKAWGVYTDNPRVPDGSEITGLLPLVDYKSIKINRNEMFASLEKQAQMVDLGGIAKGYAADEAVKMYMKHGIDSALLNLGGNLVAYGVKPDGSMWKVGIQNPRAENGEYIGIVEVKDKAVVTSGDYQRYFEHNGKRYHHILDPKTGYPSESGLISTTIVCDSSTEADALSTAVFVMGLEDGYELVKELDGVEAIFISDKKEIYTTEGIRDKFLFSDESKEYKYD